MIDTLFSSPVRFKIAAKSQGDKLDSFISHDHSLIFKEDKGSGVLVALNTRPNISSEFIGFIIAPLRSLRYADTNLLVQSVRLTLFFLEVESLFYETGS